MKRICGYILFAICTADLMLNQMKIVKASYIPCESITEYQTRYDSKSAEVSAIMEQDHDFYRIEDIASYSYDDINDSLVYGYRSVSHYSTGDHKSVRMFMKAIGFNYNGLYDEYTADNTDTADALLNIRYLLTEDGLEKKDVIFPAAVVLDKVVAVPADKEDKDSSHKSGFAANAAITDNSSDGLSEEMSAGVVVPADMTEDDPFLFQMQMADAFGGYEAGALDEDSRLFVPVSVISRDIEQSKEDQSSVMTIVLSPSCDGELYFYIRGLKNTAQDMSVAVNGHVVSGYANASAIKVLDLGHFDKGEDVVVTMSVNGDPDLADFGEPLIVTENGRVLEQYVARSEERAVSVTEKSATKLTLHAETCDGRGILLSLPWEEGFDAVGVATGRYYKVSQAFGALTLIETPEGCSEDIELRYSIPGTEPGLLAGAAGLVMLAAAVLIRRRSGII
jgi:uncharacterized membrane protein YfhO